MYGRNREAVEAMLEALAAPEFDGTLRPVDAARVAALRALADQVDDEPGNAQMWRQYRDALEGMVPANVDADPRDALLAELRSEMGHAAPAGPSDVGGA